MENHPAETAPILVSKPTDGIVLLTFNRPERLNAFNSTFVTALLEALDKVAADSSCRAVILTGAGRGFCAGLDLAGYGVPPGADGETALRLKFAVAEQLGAVINRMRSLRVPVIAAVNGAAAGGGLALALGADVRIASATASFSVAFIKMGLSGCDMGVSWLLPRAIGAGRAFELLLTGRTVDADEAGRIGLVNRVVASEELIGTAMMTAAQVAGNSPWGVQMTKEVMWTQLEIASLKAGMDLENRTQILCGYTGDMAEATSAFKEKRPPRWGS